MSRNLSAPATVVQGKPIPLACQLSTLALPNLGLSRENTLLCTAELESPLECSENPARGWSLRPKFAITAGVSSNSGRRESLFLTATRMYLATCGLTVCCLQCEHPRDKASGSGVGRLEVRLEAAPRSASPFSDRMRTQQSPSQLRAVSPRSIRQCRP